MGSMVWFLVVIFDPSNFNPQYRTPDVLERVMEVFVDEADCQEAIDILSRGTYPPGGLRIAQYACLKGTYEEGIWRPLDDPTELGEGVLR